MNKILNPTWFDRFVPANCSCFTSKSILKFLYKYVFHWFFLDILTIFFRLRLIFSLQNTILEQLVFEICQISAHPSTRLNAALLQPKPNLTGSLSWVGFWQKNLKKDVLTNNCNKENKFIKYFLIPTFNQNSSDLFERYYVARRILGIVGYER